MTIGHATSKNEYRASATMFPQVGVGGWIPNPRKESADSARMAVAMSRVTLTMTGPMAFGSMWENMIRRFDAPAARAASTNSFSRKDRKTPVRDGQEEIGCPHQRRVRDSAVEARQGPDDRAQDAR